MDVLLRCQAAQFGKVARIHAGGFLRHHMDPRFDETPNDRWGVRRDHADNSHVGPGLTKHLGDRGMGALDLRATHCP